MLFHYMFEKVSSTYFIRLINKNMEDRILTKLNYNKKSIYVIYTDSSNCLINKRFFFSSLLSLGFSNY